MIFPCKDCEDRFVGCHGTCERYLKACEENEKRKKAELSRYQSWALTIEAMERFKGNDAKKYRKRRTFKK